MKYIYSWLKEIYPDLPPLDKTQELLIQIGHDIEDVTPIDYAGVVIAQILDIQPHPNADRLRLVTITNGSHERKVVCGAPTLSVGQKVAYAPIGTTLPCALTLQPIKIRGEASDGMLCAEDELGIGPSHAELLPIGDEAEIGQPLAEYLPPDAILSLDITSNRGDVLSHFGLARDICAAHSQTLLETTFKTPEYTDTSADTIAITTLQPDVGAFSLGVVSAPTSEAKTPLLWQARLNWLGLKSINVATDITNYLLYEYGQPLHAYDANALGLHPELSVRRAHDGETFHALTGGTYTLSPQSLVITNHNQPIALAGVMGGESTKTTTATTRVVFESAYFYPKAISVMSRGLNLLTDSAIRFERGIDPALRAKVLAHAQAVWQDITHGAAQKPLEVVNSTPPAPTASMLTFDRINQFIGTTIPSDRVERILTALGCTVKEKSDRTIDVVSPQWRYDIVQTEDYYEELARMIGLQSVPKTPLAANVPQGRRTRFWRVEALKDMFVSMGAYEIITYPFMRARELEMLDKDVSGPKLKLVPLEDKPYLRPSLLPGMLTTISTNPDVPQLFLFEIAKVYSNTGETPSLIIGTAGSNESDIDNLWRNLFERLRLPVSSWMTRVTTVSPELIQSYKIRKSVVMVLEVSVDDIMLNRQTENPQVTIPDLDLIHYEPMAKFQASRRDVAVIISKDISPDTIAATIKETASEIVEVELFDHYEDIKLGDNNRSLAYHIYYQSPEKTLTTEEIQTLHHTVETKLMEHYHATIR